jgi:GT2 family glycosyltransferase
VIHLMGSDRILTRALWSARLDEIWKTPAGAAPPVAQPFAHAGRFDVSAIASLYRGGPFIRRFLENIVSQTMFDRSELIIVDADSPDGEFEEIKRFQERFPNIVYHRAPTRIGIYEAWNIGVGLTRGRCLTNVNLDDLRRRDSFERQFEALEQSGADVVYQNFYYSLDPALSFEEIAAMGFVSELPQVTPTTLTQLNAPHNGPMWRRELHDAVGLFDARFKVVGDWEFWLRCATQGKRFHRIDAPHIAYFLNPDGLSTRPSASALEEHREVWRRYRGLLIEALDELR